MLLQLSNEDLAQLLRAALGGRAEVRGVSCGEDAVTLKVAVGIIPASVEFREFRLASEAVTFRAAGAVAPRLLGLLQAQLEAASIRVDGDRLHVPLPARLAETLEVTALRVTPAGLEIEGRCRGLPPPALLG